jgi:DNA-directed RNA polymerase specialized sigma24 family protein
MSDDAERSVTQWIKSLKEGDDGAAQKLWQRYFEALVRLARSRLRGVPKALADEEDAALNAFDSFCRGAARNRYPRLDDRDDLWRLLVVITERKALDQARHQRRQRRGGGKVCGMPEVADGDLEGRGGAGLPSPEPTPEFAALVADECRDLFGRLRDDSLRAVARLRMEGYTNQEVSERLGCSLRTVARKLELIRWAWTGDGGRDHER